MVVDVPEVADGAALWALTRDVGGLDVNSPYAYLLWCHEFSDTSVVVRDGDTVVGFVTGFRRPARPDRLFVWQIAVDPAFRGMGLATMMLAELVERHAGATRFVEATVTPSNEASWRTFERLAEWYRAGIARSSLFGAELFPRADVDERVTGHGPLEPAGVHDDELLVVVGPLVASRSTC